MSVQAISAQTLKRLPSYYNYLKSLPAQVVSISATAIARGLCQNDVQVRKDLAAVSGGGRPKIGYNVALLIGDIERQLGGVQVTSAALIGVGDLGRAILGYDGFFRRGIDVSAVFDSNPDICGRCIGGRQVLSPDKLGGMCRLMNIKIGIITVPGAAAQQICDSLTSNGVVSILNFTSVTLAVPENVTVVNIDIDASFSALISGTVRN